MRGGDYTLQDIGSSNGVTAVTTDGPPARLFIPDMRVEWSGWLAFGIVWVLTLAQKETR